MDIISESSTAEASQGLIRYVIDKKVARRPDVPGSDLTPHTYVSPYLSHLLEGKQSPQRLVEKCQELGIEVWLLEVFEN